MKTEEHKLLNWNSLLIYNCTVNNGIILTLFVVRLIFHHTVIYLEPVSLGCQDSVRFTVVYQHILIEEGSAKFSTLKQCNDKDTNEKLTNLHCKLLFCWVSIGSNIFHILVWFGSCDAFHIRPSWVLAAALFRDWSELLFVRGGTSTISGNFSRYLSILVWWRH